MTPMSCKSPDYPRVLMQACLRFLHPEKKDRAVEDESWFPCSKKARMPVSGRQSPHQLAIIKER